MTGIRYEHLREIVERTLALMEPHDPGINSPEAVELIIGTAAHESLGGHYLRQHPGPALGIFQMEPATYRDLWRWLNAKRPALAQSLWELSTPALSDAADYPEPIDMAGNLWFAVGMCRANYRRKPAWKKGMGLPAAGDIRGQAEAWKKFWNTTAGKGTVEQYMRHWREYVG